MVTNSEKIYRIFGKCNAFCIRFSQVISIEALATHRVLLEFKHWVVYINVFCFIHRALETWSIEKIFHKFADLKGKSMQYKVIQNGSVWITCSTYSRVLFLQKRKILSKCIFLDKIVGHLINNNAGYNPLIDNCQHFKTQFWRWLIQNV